MPTDTGEGAPPTNGTLRMRLGTVDHRGTSRAARFDGETVRLADANRLDDLIRGDADLSSAFHDEVPRSEVQVLAALRPPVILCAGQNYRDHLDEKAPVVVDNPEFFLKAGQTIVDPHETVVIDARVTRKLDCETELGIVIGRPGRHIAPADALDHIFGYLVFNDVTARDRQVVLNEDGSYGGMALGPGKNFDGASRVGPEVVTADEIGNPHRLALTTHVNGELRQSNSTANMIFNVNSIVAYLSTLLTLRPGTIIATGTPGGTGWGMDTELGGTGVTPPGCSPASYLESGDTVQSTIEGVGELVFEIA